jgi:hypothetical protein
MLEVGGWQRVAMADAEIRFRGRTVERFVFGVDPDDELECVALLRRWARELRKPVDGLISRATGKRKPRPESSSLAASTSGSHRRPRPPTLSCEA